MENKLSKKIFFFLFRELFHYFLSEITGKDDRNSFGAKEKE